MPEKSTTPDLVEAIRAMLEAGDRRDADTMMSIFDPDVVLDLSRVGLGSFRGHAAVRDFLADWWRSYEQFKNKPEEIIDLDNGVVLSINHQIARPVGVSGQVERTDAYVFLFDAGAFMRWTAYPDIDEGRAAAERLARNGSSRCRRTWTSYARFTRRRSAAISVLPIGQTQTSSG